ncbi:MAG: HAD family phosphatase [Pseudomonadota bacterium]
MHQKAPPDQPDPNPKADLFAGVRLLIFDFDGVVADSEVISLQTLQDALSRFGIDLSLQEVRDRFLGRSLATVEAFLRDHHSSDTPSGFADHWQDTLYARFRAELMPVAGIHTLLAALDRDGIPYCIASSGTHERIGVALDAMRMALQFRDVFSAEQVTRGKPDPDLFLFAASQVGVAPQDCLVIEDSLYGVRAAKAAGMRCIGFVGGSHLSGAQASHADMLSRAGADHVVEAFADLPFG